MKYILPSTWAEAEKLYFEGECSMSEIARRCDMHRATILARAKKFNWPNHASLRLGGAVSERAALRRAIALKLTHLETRMQKTDDTNAADSERQAREYASLLNTIEKLDVKERTWRQSLMLVPKDNQLASESIEGDDNVEQWRAELARRIARLGAQWQG